MYTLARRGYAGLNVSQPSRRVVLAVVAAVALSLPGCGKSRDDDDHPASPPPTAQPPPPPAAVTADPVDPTPPAAQPAAPSPSAAPAPAGTSSGTKPKGKPASNNSPIPSALVPKPLQPLVPKIPANVLP